jgi:ectoine hydroxylase-related dioxygenase (phytanoyl-CoA dioxygenase family)
MPYTHDLIPASLNPELDDETRRQVERFMRDGYLLLEDAITSEQVAALRDLFATHVTPDRTQLIPRGLLDVDARFVELVDNPPVMRVMRAILGNCVQLHSIAAIAKYPGGEVQSWHRDGPWPMDPAGTPYGSVPGQINCGYYLDELDDELGPVWVLPRSQRVAFRPPSTPVELPDQLAIYAKPGQAVIFDGWLWHRGGANRSDSRVRRNCMYCYQNAWMKSREDFATPAVRALREGASPERRLLLGELERW